MQYKNQGTGSKIWAIGTGWMITNDVLVTAGHCVYNWAEGYGRATSIRAYVGYAGTDVSEQQFSVGEVVATTSGWLAGGKNKTKDVAFVKLKDPFKNIKPFAYEPTPLKGNEDLFIVGYPSDKTWTSADGKKTEGGGQMYESTGKVEWNLVETEYMLSYNLSTAGGMNLRPDFSGQKLIRVIGNSGSPVLLSNLTTSVATHVRGFRLGNEGTSIGTYGNWYPPYINVINNTANYEKKVVRTCDNGIIKYVNVPTDSKQESVLKAFSSVKDIGAKIVPGILQLGFPFLGPVGGPLAALAGTVLGWAGSLCESNFGPEGDFSTNVSEKNYAERAILAEAAVYTVAKLNTDQLGDLDLLDKINDYFRVLKPNFGNLSPKLLGTLLEPSTRIALDSMLIKDKIAEKAKSQTESGTTNERVQISASDDEENEASIDNDAEAFMTKLLTDTYKCPGEESFIDVLGSVISQGLKLALPIMQTAASGLAALNNTTSTEAAMEKSEVDKHVILLAKRAVLGEAVLQGLMKVDVDTLEGIKIPCKDDNGEIKEEAFFDLFKAMAQRIGRQVLDSAPKVIKAATPIVKELLKGELAKFGVGSTLDTNGTENKQGMEKREQGTEKWKQDDAIADAVENHIVGLMDLEPGSDHPHLKMPLEDVMREVEKGNLDSTRFITMEE